MATAARVALGLGVVMHVTLEAGSRSRDSDEVVAAALRARSGAPVGTMAFPSLQWMK
uniref:Uncharacterized protein n=1 Tax=Oryza sativa subsp. japonica TaxID=39947 RepID=Q6ZKD6_ORYSJ|nr:hypothetical protein [Oryza sativa Japonica Group]